VISRGLYPPLDDGANRSPGGRRGRRTGHSLGLVNTRIAIDTWARDIAVSEAPRVRRAVRDVIVGGGGCGVALQVVRRRLARLTPEQHGLVVAAIGEVDESAA
jgi:hypothetical protein